MALQHANTIIGVDDKRQQARELQLIATFGQRAQGKNHLMDFVDKLRQRINKLDAEQKSVALAPVDQCMLVLAGPGSGKTATMIARVGSMVARGVQEKHITMLSFSRAAVQELKDRLAALMGSAMANKVHISTYHSLAIRIVRGYVEELDEDRLNVDVGMGGRGRNPGPKASLIKEKDVDDLYKDILMKLYKQAAHMAATVYRPPTAASIAQGHAQAYAMGGQGQAQQAMRRDADPRLYVDRIPLGLMTSSGVAMGGMSFGPGGGGGAQEAGAGMSYHGSGMAAAGGAGAGASSSPAGGPAPDPDETDSDGLVERVFRALPNGGREILPEKDKSAQSCLWKLKNEARTVKGIFEKVKLAGLDHKACASSSNAFVREVVSRAGAEFQESLADEEQFEFSDVIHMATVILRVSQAARDKFGPAFRYIIADEAQDTSGMQLKLLQAVAFAGLQSRLALPPPADSQEGSGAGSAHGSATEGAASGAGASSSSAIVPSSSSSSSPCLPLPALVVVGDAKQAIYGFQGSVPAVFERFLQVYPGTTVKMLRTCYRSTARIVDVFNTIIYPDVQGQASTARPGAPAGAPVLVVKCRDTETEAHFIVNSIVREKIRYQSTTGQALPWKEFAILTRQNAVAVQLCHALWMVGIPFTRAEKDSALHLDRLNVVAATLCMAAKMLVTPVDYFSLVPARASIFDPLPPSHAAWQFPFRLPYQRCCVMLNHDTEQASRDYFVKRDQTREKKGSRLTPESINALRLIRMGLGQRILDTDPIVHVIGDGVSRAQVRATLTGLTDQRQAMGYGFPAIAAEHVKVPFLISMDLLGELGRRLDATAKAFKQKNKNRASKRKRAADKAAAAGYADDEDEVLVDTWIRTVRNICRSSEAIGKWARDVCALLEKHGNSHSLATFCDGIMAETGKQPYSTNLGPVRGGTTTSQYCDVTGSDDPFIRDKFEKVMLPLGHVPAGNRAAQQSNSKKIMPIAVGLDGFPLGKWDPSVADTMVAAHKAGGVGDPGHLLPPPSSSAVHGYGASHSHPSSGSGYGSGHMPAMGGHAGASSSAHAHGPQRHVQHHGHHQAQPPAGPRLPTFTLSDIVKSEAVLFQKAWEARREALQGGLAGGAGAGASSTGAAVPAIAPDQRTLTAMFGRGTGSNAPLAASSAGGAAAAGAASGAMAAGGPIDLTQDPGPGAGAGAAADASGGQSDATEMALANVQDQNLGALITALDGLDPSMHLWQAFGEHLSQLANEAASPLALDKGMVSAGAAVIGQSGAASAGAYGQARGGQAKGGTVGAATAAGSAAERQLRQLADSVKDERDAVTVGTAHSSKGREFAYTFVARRNLIPSTQAGGDGNDDEDRPPWESGPGERDRSTAAQLAAAGGGAGNNPLSIPNLLKMAYGKEQGGAGAASSGASGGTGGVSSSSSSSSSTLAAAAGGGADGKPEQDSVDVALAGFDTNDAEERRLLFVAASRAKTLLVMSEAETGSHKPPEPPRHDAWNTVSGGTTKINRPCPFLAELLHAYGLDEDSDALMAPMERARRERDRANRQAAMSPHRHQQGGQGQGQGQGPHAGNKRPREETAADPAVVDSPARPGPVAAQAAQAQAAAAAGQASSAPAPAASRSVATASSTARPPSVVLPVYLSGRSDYGVLFPHGLSMGDVGAFEAGLAMKYYARLTADGESGAGVVQGRGSLSAGRGSLGSALTGVQRRAEGGSSPAALASSAARPAAGSGSVPPASASAQPARNGGQLPMGPGYSAGSSAPPAAVPAPASQAQHGPAGPSQRATSTVAGLPAFSGHGAAVAPPTIVRGAAQAQGAVGPVQAVHAQGHQPQSQAHGPRPVLLPAPARAPAPAADWDDDELDDAELNAAIDAHLRSMAAQGQAHGQAGHGAGLTGPAHHNAPQAHVGQAVPTGAPSGYPPAPQVGYSTGPAHHRGINPYGPNSASSGAAASAAAHAHAHGHASDGYGCGYDDDDAGLVDMSAISGMSDLAGHGVDQDGNPIIQGRPRSAAGGSLRAGIPGPRSPPQPGPRPGGAAGGRA